MPPAFLTPIMGPWTSLPYRLANPHHRNIKSQRTGEIVANFRKFGYNGAQLSQDIDKVLTTMV